MKRLLLILLLLPFLFSCNRGAQLPDLEISLDELVVDHQGYDLNGKSPVVTLTANADWSAEPSEDWLQPNVFSGGTRTLVTIKVSPNFTDDERTGYIVFKNEAKEVTLKVHQKKGEVDIEQIIYEVPVIFHIMYNEEDIRNPDERKRKRALNSEELQSIIHEVNRLYGLPPVNKLEEEEDEQNLRERNNVPKLETRIRFVLAKVDPKGKVLPNMGVTRTAITERYLRPYDILNDKEGGKYHSMSWPLDRYVNVFVFPFSTEGQGVNEGLLLGISSMPHASEKKPIEGLDILNKRVQHFSNYNHCIVVNAEAFEERIYSEFFLKNKLGISTIAHELGHYLGLAHTFTEIRREGGGIITDACEDTDYCLDTPTYNREAYNRTAREIIAAGGSYQVMLEGLLRRTDCANVKFISTNVMDYEWSHSDRFTPDQVKRMRQVLYYSPTVPGQKMIVFDNTKSLELIEVEPRFTACRGEHTHHH